jgi:hypothetical protein
MSRPILKMTTADVLAIVRPLNQNSIEFISDEGKFLE